MSNPLVGIIMGSDSDLPVMSAAVDILKDFAIPYEVTVVSAHRTPDRMVDYGREAAGRGLRVIIAGAGGAAHLPGMMASLTPLPVIGVPVNSSNSIQGIDSLLSIVQMPGGVPVATVGVDNAKNAGLLAARILGSHDETVRGKVAEYAEAQKQRVLDKLSKMENQ
jgi:5-(carboxyamino)imidazole ribonucleotide mutase